jgi:siroheme synthase
VLLAAGGWSNCRSKKGCWLGPVGNRIRVLTMKGKVYLMEAVSGDADLLNPQAVRVLRTAEVVLHDDSVSQEILDLVPASAQVRSVHKLGLQTGSLQDKIHSLLISAARDGHIVVRLKSSSTGGQFDEETSVLTQAGVVFEVISGAESAMGTAAGANR